MRDNAFGMCKKIKRAIVCAVFAVVLALSGCSTARDNTKYYLDFLGTSVQVSINTDNAFFWQKNKLEECFDQIDGLLKRINSCFSTEEPNSFVCRYNALEFGESIEVNQEFATVFRVAQDVYGLTDGAFNPSVKLLVDLWGFSKRHKAVDFVKTCAYDRQRNADGSFDLPNQDYVSAFLSLTDFTKAELNGLTLTKQVMGVTVQGVTYNQLIDLSGIVKGYATDEIAKVVSSFGYTDYYVCIGTSSMYLAEDDGNAFTLGVTNPTNPSAKPITDIKVKNKSVSTSGVYLENYALGGVKYHHIINSETGAPAVTDLLSATICAKNGALCDGLSTAIIVMGSQKGKEFLLENGYEFVLVTDAEEIITNMER